MAVRVPVTPGSHWGWGIKSVRLGRGVATVRREGERWRIDYMERKNRGHIRTERRLSDPNAVSLSHPYLQDPTARRRHRPLPLIYPPGLSGRSLESSLRGSRYTRFDLNWFNCELWIGNQKLSIQ